MYNHQYIILTAIIRLPNNISNFTCIKYVIKYVEYKKIPVYLCTELRLHAQSEENRISALNQSVKTLTIVCQEGRYTRYSPLDPDGILLLLINILLKSSANRQIK